MCPEGPRVGTCVSGTCSGRARLCRGIPLHSLALRSRALCTLTHPSVPSGLAFFMVSLAPSLTHVLAPTLGPRPASTLLQCCCNTAAGPPATQVGLDAFATAPAMIPVAHTLNPHPLRTHSCPVTHLPRAGCPGCPWRCPCRWGAPCGPSTRRRPPRRPPGRCPRRCRRRCGPRPWSCTESGCSWVVGG